MTCSFSTVMFVVSPGRTALVINGQKIVLSPVRTKLLPAINLGLGYSETYKLIKQLTISENVTTAHIRIGTGFPWHTDVKNAIRIFRNTFLSAGNVELWSATGVDVIGYETLVNTG